MSASQDSQRSPSFRTGFRDLDAILARVDPPDVVILAARPSIGKSSLALDIARHLAVDENLPVAIFSLESGKQEVMTRLLAAQSQVDSWRMRRGTLRPDDQARIALASTALAGASLYVDDSPSLDAAGMAAELRRLRNEGTHPALVVYDYMQLAHGVTSADGGYSRLIEEFKALAQELSVPILVPCQLARVVEQRPDHRPLLSDVDSLNADLTLLLYRDEVYSADSAAKGIVEITAGGPNGPIDGCELRFRARCGRFEDME